MGGSWVGHGQAVDHARIQVGHAYTEEGVRIQYGDVYRMNAYTGRLDLWGVWGVCLSIPVYSTPERVLFYFIKFSHRKHVPSYPTLFGESRLLVYFFRGSVYTSTTVYTSVYTHQIPYTL